MENFTPTRSMLTAALYLQTGRDNAVWSWHPEKGQKGISESATESSVSGL